MADGSYYLATGTISKATLIGSSANNVENFAVQSDMLTYPGWTIPDRRLTRRPRPARITVAANLTMAPDGFYEFQWGWPFWTTGQLAYWLTTFHTGPDQYTSMSPAVTVQTYMDTAYVAFQCLMYRPVWEDHYKSDDWGYLDVIIRFAGGVIIT